MLALRSSALMCAIAALSGAGALQTPQWSLAKPAPAPDGRPALLGRAAESKCNECHAGIVAEWAATTHALAWEDELYQEELAGRKKAEACHGCHAPAPLHAAPFSAKPQARADERHFGVSCESCHLAPDGALLGPTGAATDKHATRRSDTLRGAGSNALCSACHRTTVGPVIGIAKDFELSELPARGESCVACHMAPLRELESGGETRVVRSHELQTPRDPAFLAQSFELSLEREGPVTRVVIANRAGHRVPGLIGRELEFRASALDAQGKELARGELSLTTDSYLPLGERVRLELAAAAAKVRIVALHHDPRLKQPVRFLELDLIP